MTDPSDSPTPDAATNGHAGGMTPDARPAHVPSEAIAESDWESLRQAVRQLEQPSFAGKLTDTLGEPIEMLLDKLPDAVQGKIEGATEAALTKALEVALKTFGDNEPGGRPWNLTHKLATTFTGAAGGFFGMPALAVELPVTTVVMLRSIADIARSKGEDLSQPEAQLACLEVFALGSGGAEATDEAIVVAGEKTQEDREFVRAQYYIARAALAQSVKNVVTQMAGGSGSLTTRPVMTFISRVASRFGIAVSEKAAAQAVPVLGAIGGGLVNVMFTDHFQDTAEAHFAIRALERKYGAGVVEQAYDQESKKLEAK